MQIGPYTIIALLVAVILIGVAMAYRGSRTIVGVVLAIIGLALTMTGSGAIVGVPILLVATLLFYSVYAERRKLRNVTQ